MNENKSESKLRTARKIIRYVDDTFNTILLAVLVLLLLFGCYSLWDSKQVYSSANSTQYEIYKPRKEDNVSFDELRSVNSDVIGWLTVYGTKIDYPLTQGENNSEYLNKNAEGKYSMSGAIFVDSESAGDFSDYNTLVHGHHMEASAMFGDLSKFSNQQFFEEHPHGELYIEGRRYGIVFFSFSLVDAYNSDVFRTGITGEEKQKEYLQMLIDSAMYTRKAGQELAEHLIVLCTCSSDMTNGRHVLAGYITDEIFENKFESENDKAKETWKANFIKGAYKTPIYIWMLLLLVVLILLLIFVNVLSKWIGQRRNERNQSCEREGMDNDDLSK